MKFISPLLLFIVALTFVDSSYAQEPGLINPAFKKNAALFTRAEIIKVVDSMVMNFTKKYDIPGLTYAIVVKDSIVHSGNSGIANMEKKYPVSYSTAFRIASMSKSFTAMAILQLRDQGRLKLDDPMHFYIPELKQVKPASPDAPDITIRHLLTHSSGLPEDNPWGDRQLSVSDTQMLEMISKGLSLSNPPGTGYEYSNLGYAMLGHIIKKASGKYYADYIKENILDPLGMKSTWYEVDEVPEKQLAIGYRRLDGKWEKQPLLHDGIYGAMGGMFTTLHDFVKYAGLHLSAWPPSQDKDDIVIRNSSIREMQAPWQFSSLNPSYKYFDGRTCPMVTAYGYGLRWSRDCEGRITIGHSGGLPGFGSNWTILPEYGIGVISFGNSTYAPTARLNFEILDYLVRNARPERIQIPVSPILEQRKNELAAILPNWNNARASGIFAINFFDDYQLEKLKKQSEELFQRVGKIQKIGPMIAENNLRGYFIMEGERGGIRVYFTMSPEFPPMIQALDLEVVD